MSVAGRKTARIRVLDTGEAKELEYQYPLIDISGSARVVTHSPIGERSVTQHLGAEARTLEMRGHCYLDEANFIDTLSEYSMVEVRSERDGWSGFAIVTDHNTTHTKRKGGKRTANTNENKNYDYRISMTETAAPPPEGPES